jgi:hypothetical protein
MGCVQAKSAYFETVSNRVFRLASVLLAASDAVEVGQAITVAAKIVDLLEELKGLKYEETRQYHDH